METVVSQPLGSPRAVVVEKAQVQTLEPLELLDNVVLTGTVMALNG